MMEKLIEKLIEHAPLTLVVLGAILFVLGAASTLPIGSPPIQIDIYGRGALIFFGLIVTLAGLYLIIRQQQKVDGRYVEQMSSKAKPMGGRGLALPSRALAILDAVGNYELLAKENLSSNQITVRIHEEYSLDFDDQVKAALHQLNVQRLGRKLREYFPSTRFRPIRPPRILENGIEIDVAPINFAHWIILADPQAPVSGRDHVREQIQQVLGRVPKKLQSNHPILNWHNARPLAVMMVVLTKDGKTLLRKRGESVLCEALKWDISFGGYCGEIDRMDDEIYVGRTAENELRREIGVLAADPRAMIFTGLHLNTATAALDILGIWKIEATSYQLAELLTKKYPGTTKIFRTSKRAVEPFVWDIPNIIVDFQSADISLALSAAKSSIRDMAPESLACLLLGLESVGHSVSEFDV